MSFLFLISLHVHIKRPYSFPLIINIQLFCCAGGIYLGQGHGSTVIFKVTSSISRISGDY